MRILLTGVGGFIGSHVVRWFLQNTDWEIVGLEHWHINRKSDGHRLQSALAGLNARQLSRLEVHPWDLTHPFTPAITNKLFAQPVDIVISMASDSHVTKSVHFPGECWYNNTQLAYNMLELARHNPIKMFIQVSTDEVYGDAGWDSPGHVEWDTILPSNPYSASKAAQEALAIAYWRTYNVPLVITNTMNVIGEWQDPEKFLPKAINKISTGQPLEIHGDASGRVAQRVWLDARNMAAALMFICAQVTPKLCTVAESRPHRFHIVGDTELSVQELAQRVAKYLDKPLIANVISGDTVRPGIDRRYALVDTQLKALGFHAPFCFDETLVRIINWAKANSNWVYA